jgi:sterol desaturase/sphingolipid hydroxylase (fatty acid hydroxylase superfamily)
MDATFGRVPEQIAAYYRAAAEVYTSPWLFAGVAALLLIERVRPAVREQKVLSWGLFEDFCWFNLDIVFKVAAFPAFVGLVSLAYDKLTGGFTLSLVTEWPAWLRVSFSLLIYDFYQWLHHFVRHKVAWLWQFHVIHHSQTELNLFTDLRVHFGEYLAAHVLTFIPLFALNLTPFAIMGVGFFTIWYTRFIHTNVRTNLGFLKHILVTPQYHRVHHSIETRHYDKNFGVLFTLWDRVFGTMHPDYDEYPQTGVVGVDFGRPSTFAPREWAATLGRQLVYPFAAILRSARPAKVPAESGSRS